MQSLTEHKSESTKQRGAAAQAVGGVFVIADDFTGACDTGIVFRQAGRDVAIDLAARAGWGTQNARCTAWVKLTDTRRYDVGQAVARVEEALSGLAPAAAAGARIYQKVDSTMRGNVGAEIEAALRTLHLHVAVVCTAFPGVARTVRDGRLLVGGVPIGQTAYARDPRNPIRSDTVGGIIRATTSLPVEWADPAGLAAKLRELEGTPRLTAVAVDAVTERDLASIAQTVVAFPWALPVGSAGLARPMARLWTPGEGRSTSARLHATRAIVASGSANPRSLRQLRVLAATRDDLRLVRIDKSRLLTEADASGEMSRARRSIDQALRSGGVLGIALSDGRLDSSPYRGAFESFVAELVGYAVHAKHVDPAGLAVIVAGADTCFSTCRELGVRTLKPQAEIVTGIPWSVGDGGYNIISKAGGFGADDALVRCVRYALGE